MKVRGNIKYIGSWPFEDEEKEYMKKPIEECGYIHMGDIDEPSIDKDGDVMPEGPNKGRFW